MLASIGRSIAASMISMNDHSAFSASNTSTAEATDITVKGVWNAKEINNWFETWIKNAEEKRTDHIGKLHAYINIYVCVRTLITACCQQCANLLATPSVAITQQNSYRTAIHRHVLALCSTATILPAAVTNIDLLIFLHCNSNQHTKNTRAQEVHISMQCSNQTRSHATNTPASQQKVWSTKLLVGFHGLQPDILEDLIVNSINTCLYIYMSRILPNCNISPFQSSKLSSYFLLHFKD